MNELPYCVLPLVSAETKAEHRDTRAQRPRTLRSGTDGPAFRGPASRGPASRGPAFRGAASRGPADPGSELSGELSPDEQAYL